MDSQTAPRPPPPQGAARQERVPARLRVLRRCRPAEPPLQLSPRRPAAQPPRSQLQALRPPRRAQLHRLRQLPRRARLRLRLARLLRPRSPPSALRRPRRLLLPFAVPRLQRLAALAFPPSSLSS